MRLATVSHRRGVDLARLGEVDQGTRQELGVTRVDDVSAAKHLADDDLDVLVVDRHALGAVHGLHLVDEVLFDAASAQHLKHVVRVSRTAQQAIANLDVIALAQGALDHRIRVGLHRATHLGQALALRQLLVDDNVGAVIRVDGQRPEVALVLEGDRSGHGSDRGAVLRNASLEQLLHTRQTTGDVTADTTLVEGTHGQLRTRLTNRLCRDDTDGLADIDELASGHGLAVALRAHTRRGLARQHGAHLDLGHTSRYEAIDVFFSQV